MINGQKIIYILITQLFSRIEWIENEWQRIKEDELAGRMFEDEYELSLAVMSAIESRQKRNGLEVKKYHFN